MIPGDLLAGEQARSLSLIFECVARHMAAWRVSVKGKRCFASCCRNENTLWLHKFAVAIHPFRSHARLIRSCNAAQNFNLAECEEDAGAVREPVMPQALARNTDTLEFMHSMLAQLRRMAGEEEYEVLAYMIEMACIEADDILRGACPSARRVDKRDSAA